MNHRIYFPLFNLAIAASATIKIDRWLDNSSKLNCISNEGQLPDDYCTSTELPRIARLMLSNTLRKKMQDEKEDGNHSWSSSAKHSQCSDVSTPNDAKTTISQKSNSTDNNLKSSEAIASKKNEAVPQSKKLELLRRFRGIIKSEPVKSEQKPFASTNNSNGKPNVPTSSERSESEKYHPIVAKKSQPAVPLPKELSEHSG